MFWTARRVDYCRDFNKKFGICLYEHNRFTFFCHYLPFLCFSPCSKRKKKKICVCCSERTPRFYSVEFYGTDLYNFKSSYFSIHAKYSSIKKKKHVRKIRIKKKKMTASHLYFLNIVPLLYYVLQSPKRKKKTKKQKPFEINALFIHEWKFSCLFGKYEYRCRRAFYSLLPFNT